MPEFQHTLEGINIEASVCPFHFLLLEHQLNQTPLPIIRGDDCFKKSQNLFAEKEMSTLLRYCLLSCLYFLQISMIVSASFMFWEM